jgi:hypothetical protein
MLVCYLYLLMYYICMFILYMSTTLLSSTYIYFFHEIILFSLLVDCIDG